MAKRNNVWANIDWVTVLLFLLLIFLGWINIYAAIYNPENQSIFDVSERYGKQLIWIGAALALGFLILLIETNFYVFFSYIIYGFFILLLILVLFMGKEINGARSWFDIGGVRLQPSEFGKFATALALAKYMSSFGFKLQRFKSIVVIALLILAPAFFILLQNDTGSALVYFSFVLVLFREGLSGVILFFGSLIALLFVLALVLSNLILNAVLIGAVLSIFLIMNTRLKQFGIILIIFSLSIGIFFGLNEIVSTEYQPADFLFSGGLLGALITLIYSIRKQISNYIIVTVIFIGALLFSVSVDYGFTNLLEPHQQVRINELLGIESNPQGAGYHVNQSKIAIGSGGFWGKGFLNGTQTKFDFVPEQSTDFIFCTVGEEWGFVGTFVLIILFLTLFIRLVLLAERQRSGFSRIYGYSVAVILFFHFMVNIGMTIGIMPVIGIPLPFFSYGGSSLWSFTILLFIFIRLDASRLDHLSN
ncbi:rod shape-determining protein RodA [Maribellus maritimus]|uniref:rod shape-determining protein RodA n=1 Tax=Maribellus maritimus TaxID=2870838 RepID=UPI001EEA40D7|nr:rod shape-determining protein RodA [Maribellus maritimus]MCG6186140.1 rod shape-determining protein RodA [Maribellus maritimus]